MFGINEIDVARLKTLLASGEKVRLIDVREPSEMAQGMIDGAEAMPLHTVPAYASGFKADETIVFYCLSGARSAQACMFLERTQGIKSSNLRGGIASWAHAGNALKKPALA